MKSTLNIVIVFLLFTSQCFAQPCDTSGIVRITVKPSLTDANIAWGINDHWIYYNTSCPVTNKLLVYLVGSYGSPEGDTLFPYHAAKYGINAISIKYPNAFTVGSYCGNDTDPECHGKVRYEQWFGADSSSHISIDTTDCIQNRIIKLLQYLDANYPTQSWNQFYSGNTIDWSKIMVAGHSQGGGHAAFIAKYKNIQRAVMFASVVDYNNNFNQPDPWMAKPSLTPVGNYYGFINTNDELSDFTIVVQNWMSMGMGTGSDTTSFRVGCNFNYSQMLYADTLISGPLANHGSVITQGSTPLTPSGNYRFEEVWTYLLGEDCNPLGIDETEFPGEKLPFEIYDLLGRKTGYKPNILLIYIYSDGTTEKVFRIE